MRPLTYCRSDLCCFLKGLAHILASAFEKAVLVASCYATHASTVYTYTEDVLMYSTCVFLTGALGKATTVL